MWNSISEIITDYVVTPCLLDDWVINYSFNIYTKMLGKLNRRFSAILECPLY